MGLVIHSGGNQGGYVSETTLTAATTPEAAAPARAGDERLAYRSVFQRAFIRPEVGALIGAVGIWSFFWAVSETFGTAGQTFGWLDIVATLGIMAVAVSMLMIGGEFDLSSGAMTGAMGILIILMVKETGDLGGLGLPLVVALPVSLVVALGIGYFNGYMVERTGQPSFIITLATYFSLIGLKLGLAKRFVDQIQVSSPEEASDFGFFNPIFAKEWNRNDHQLEIRDFLYIVFIALGLCLIVLAIYEQWFQRRRDLVPSGLIQFGAGTAASVVGAILLHTTDGRGINAVLTVVIAAGVVVALLGWCRWRYQPSAERGAVQLDRLAGRRLLIGMAAIVASGVVAIAIDSSSQNELIFPFTTQGVRAILFMALAAIGVTQLAMASQAALLVNPATKYVVTLALALGVALIAGIIFVDSESPKFRAALAPAVLFAAVLLATWAIASSRFTERRVPEHAADRRGSLMVGLGMLSVVVGLFFRLMFTVDAEIEAEIAPAKTSVRLVWFIVFTAVIVWVLARTRFGSWTFAVGGNKEAARQVGVPAARTKRQLFMLVSFAAWLVGVLVAFRIKSIQANLGNGEEFDYIIAAVVGGTLMTGGYGTAFGGAVGAAIIAMPVIGISNARWNSDWRFLFLGVILAIAVISNRFIRTKAEGIRR
jgi:ribose/xylose/arabinose/galactoside ABC-type transport system permease subunit